MAEDTDFLQYHSSFTIAPALGDFVTGSHGNFKPFGFECDNYEGFKMPKTLIDVYALKDRDFGDETFADVFKSIGHNRIYDLRIWFGQLVELFRSHKNFMIQAEYEVVFLLNVHDPDAQNFGRMNVLPTMCGFNLEDGKLIGPIHFTAMSRIDSLLRGWSPNKEKPWRIIVPRL